MAGPCVLRVTSVVAGPCCLTSATAANASPRLPWPPPTANPTTLAGSRRSITISACSRHGAQTRVNPPLITQRAASSSSVPSSTGSSWPKFSYHIAASFTAKDRPYDPSTHVFHFNPYNRFQSRPASRPDSGQDAFFVSRVNESGAVALGVADGVGGWAESGVDPADFSHGLCDHMAAAARDHGYPSLEATATTAKATTAKSPLTARRLMQRGYDAVRDDAGIRAGGSTACVAIAAPDGILDLANLGDSGFLHLRLNAISACSEPQTHAFNTPYQLSLVPPRMAARMAAFGGASLADLPRDADVTQHRLRHGDVLILATDGVLDNLFNQDILRVASRVMVASGAWAMTSLGVFAVGANLDTLVRPDRDPHANTCVYPDTTDRTVGNKKTTAAAAAAATTLQSLLATELAKAAKVASINTKMDGPFAKEVKRYFPHERWHGGKVDDICVVAAVVVGQGQDQGGGSAKL